MISILLPWRTTDPARIRAWEYNRPRWQRLDVQLCVSDDGRAEGPFSLARAVNRARTLARGDMLAIFGADHIPPTVEKLTWIAERLMAHPWTAVYRATVAINEQGTARVYEGMPPEVAGRIRYTYINSCEGIIALRAAVWDDLGGMDERFEGWGAEDTAFKATLGALHPDGRWDGEGDALALWHPEAPRDQTAANIDRYHEYERAAREGRMREFINDARRNPGRP